MKKERVFSILWDFCKITLTALTFLAPALLCTALFPSYTYKDLFFGEANNRYCLNSSFLFAIYWTSILGFLGFLCYVLCGRVFSLLPRLLSVLELLTNTVFSEDSVDLARDYAEMSGPIGALFGGVAMAVGAVYIFSVDPEDAYRLAEITTPTTKKHIIFTALQSAMFPVNFCNSLIRFISLAALIHLLVKLIKQRISKYFYREFYKARLENANFGKRCLEQVLDKFVPRLVIDGHLIKMSGRGEFDPHNHQQVSEIGNELFDGIVGDNLLADAPEGSSVASGGEPERLTVGHFIPLLGEEKGRRFFASLSNFGSQKVAKTDLTRQEFIAAVELFLREDAAIQRSIEANGKILKKLGRLIILMASILLAALSAPILSAKLNIATLGTLILSYQFLFSKEVSRAFNGLIFVIITHPFDIGDYIIIDEKLYYVEGLGLWGSQLRGPGNQLTYITNAKLAREKIANLRRSAPMEESVMIELDGQTPAIKIARLEEELLHFTNENLRDFQKTESLHLTGLKLVNNKIIQGKWSVNHNSNFQDRKLMSRRQRLAVTGLREALEKSGVLLAEFDWGGHWADER